MSTGAQAVDRGVPRASSYREASGNGAVLCAHPTSGGPMDEQASGAVLSEFTHSLKRSPPTLRSRRTSIAHSHLKRVRSVLNGFCLWLIAQGELEIAPARGISLPAKPSGFARRAHRNSSARPSLPLSSGDAGLRGKAIFSLGYAAGCRVSEISHLLLEHTAVNAREGRLRLGIPGRAERTIILAGEAREALYAYLISGKRAQSAYLFTSQRERAKVPHGDRDGWRLRESAIHAWFQELRGAATPEEWELIGELTFHDLRRDFAFRAREAGFSETELAAYLGLVRKRRPIAGDGAREDAGRWIPSSYAKNCSD